MRNKTNDQHHINDAGVPDPNAVVSVAGRVGIATLTTSDLTDKGLFGLSGSENGPGITLRDNKYFVDPMFPSQDIMIRFNTKHNGSGLMWRVFKGATEILAPSFEVRGGVPMRSVTSQEGKETKYNVGCHGHVIVEEGGHVVIVP